MVLPSIIDLQDMTEYMCTIFAITKINNDEYLFVPSVVASKSRVESCIYKFSVKHNKWTEYSDVLHKNKITNDYHSISYNSRNNQLYIYNENSNRK